MKSLVLMLVFLCACVPKPEEIQGCGTGTEFSEVLKTCISSAASVITLDTAPTTLTVTEDDVDGESFTLAAATTESIDGELYWFITKAPTNGKLTACADRDSAGLGTGVGTVLRSCVYTPNPSTVGSDTFSYRVCANTAGTKRCTAKQVVAVTIVDDSAGLVGADGDGDQ